MGFRFVSPASLPKCRESLGSPVAAETLSQGPDSQRGELIWQDLSMIQPYLDVPRRRLDNHSCSRESFVFHFLDRGGREVASEKADGQNEGPFARSSVVNAN